jgi:3-oxoacyl-[acyl-carrier protein] reductase
MAASTLVIGSGDQLSDELADRLGGVVEKFGEQVPPNITGAVVVVGAEPPTPSDLATMSEQVWDRTVDDTMWAALAALQRAHSAFGGRGGRIVVVVPTIGMAGAARLVAYTTALEGIRAMAKSAARQWYCDDTTVNLVAAPLRLFAPALDTASAHLTAAVVTDDSTLVHTVAEAVAFLLRTDIDHLVGETIVADGGAVMLP